MNSRAIISALFLFGFSLSAQPALASDGNAPDENVLTTLFAPKENTLEPEIQGIEGALLENVHAHLLLGKERCDAPPWRVRGRYGQAETHIRSALRALGYYRPVVEKRLIPPCFIPGATGEALAVSSSGKAARKDCKKGCWSAQFVIDPGMPVRLTEVEVTIVGEAKEDTAFRALREGLPMGKGDVLNHGHYGRIKDDIVALASRLGYFDGEFVTHALRVDMERREAMVHIVYDSGPRYRFGPARIRHGPLDDGLVDRIVGWREGDFFDAQRLARMHRALVDSGYFSAVEARPRMEERRDRHVPVDVDLMPHKRYRFSAGLGMTTDGGPSGSFSALNRRFNRRGHRWSFDTDISLVKSIVGAEYRIPLVDPRTDWLSVQTGFQREDTDTAKSQGLRLGIRHTRRYANDWLGTVSMDALREDFRIGSAEDMATLIVAGLGFSHSGYDNEIRPRRGYRLNLKLNVSHTMLGSDNDFVQGYVSGKWVRGLSWGGRIILRGEVGASWVDKFSKVPASYRFFAGGDKSIRGYDFHALGPKDNLGEIIGGRHIMVGSLEYEHPVSKDWAIATFVDHGNALDGDMNIFSDPLKTSVGVGVRWFSPFGPVGMDAGFPLGEEDSTFRVHLNVGFDL
uniref:Translocation and assembly module subunit TamA n=1 Tax=Candidatus Kentrum sp. TC TaxID=2126339 RepID=A0A450YG24_9GAMM|nr:MAG: translocation and assembly module TamA [Candidatus Kentron sp. TC]